MTSSEPLSAKSTDETTRRDGTGDGDGLSARVRRMEGVLIVAPTLAKLDMSTAGEFKRQVSAVAQSEKRMVLDMEGINFVDSSGLGAILSILRELSGEGGDLRLCCLQKRVRVMFELVRMHRVLTLHNTAEEAVHALLSASEPGVEASAS